VIEYSVGKTHTKIRGVGAYENERVGKLRVSSEYEWWETQNATIQVRPSDVVAFVKNNNLR
jgi:hypothetical protein